jgi:hypothetical protein
MKKEKVIKDLGCLNLIKLLMIILQTHIIWETFMSSINI